MTDWHEQRFERRYATKPEAFKQGYKGWATHEPLPNPYLEPSIEWSEFKNGQWWAEYDYDEDRER